MIFLTITKNPYSWLLSLYKRPYNSHIHNEKLTFEDFLQQQWKTLNRDNVDVILRNPIELWNIKNRSYLRLDSKKTIHITTEAIFENPEAIIDKISQKFFIEKKSKVFTNYDQSTKDRTKNFLYYRNYYLSEKWRKELSQEAVMLINQSIDKKLMNYFGYKLLL
ncbi:hypothetical protein [Synechococcus sp. BDU 130192]|uniref:hypothetical protein n=1 Tax=Synechococcus sp. BDU 130192 TaxID=2042059 RepID=UPI000C07041A|nr:hypothetical protein [Synechococcus sp. BDU 130192]